MGASQQTVFRYADGQLLVQLALVARIVTPRWTIGLIGQYKYLPLDNDLTPKGIVSGGLVLRYNFVGKRMPTNKALYYNTLAEQQEMKDAYERQLQDKQRENDGLQSKLRKSQQENADLKALVEDCQNANAKVNGHDVYFPVNKTKIIEQERIRLNDFIASLKEQKNYKLTIIGEASSDGPSSKNFKLSEGRLNNVVDYLKKKGIEDFSIKLEKAVGTQGKQGKLCHTEFSRRRERSSPPALQLRQSGCSDPDVCPD